MKEKIEVNVEFQPEVEVEEVFIHATQGNAIELVCVVHAHPKPVVKVRLTQWHLGADLGLRPTYK